MTRARRTRWRCEFCAAFGHATTDTEALAEFLRHYVREHRSEREAA